MGVEFAPTKQHWFNALGSSARPGVLDYGRVRALTWRLPVVWRERVISRFVREWTPVQGVAPVDAINNSAAAAIKYQRALDAAGGCAVVAHLPEGWREVNAVTTEDDIRSLAQDQADECSRACSIRVSGVAELRARLRDWGIENNFKDDVAMAARMCNAKWWRRRLRAVRGRCVERSAMALGFLGAGGERYCTAESERLYLEQHGRNLAMMRDTRLRADDGSELSLLDAYQASVSNPVNRLAELVTRVKGHEAAAAARGDACVFVTLTAPSRFHAVTSSGEKNARWDGTTPRDAQAHLCGVWASVRKRLGEGGVFVHGVRIVEPHHDGCAHWHMLVWVGKGFKLSFQEIFRREALRVDGDEPGAAVHRFKSVDVVVSKGDAVGYLLKYLVKNIQVEASALTRCGDYMENPVENRVSADAPEKAGQKIGPMVWARVWGIRQFQFFGSAPVTAWRMLRRLPVGGFDAAARGVVDACHRAGDVMADYSIFLREWCAGVFGAPVVGFSWLKGWSDRCNGYGEPQGIVAIGLTTAIGCGYHLFRKRFEVLRGSRTRFNNCPASGGVEGHCWTLDTT